MIVDSHCHLDRLDFDKLDLNLDQVLDKARAKKVEHFLCVSVTLDQFPNMLDKIKHYDDVSASCGVHPLDQKDALNKQQLIDLASHDKVVAIGETGLDYYYAKDTHAVQQASFVGHIEVANQLQKPLIIHTRDARSDTINLMKQHNAENCGVFAHLYGTLALLSQSEQDRVMGFVINRFRGDIELLNPGLDWLQQKTGKPVIGVLPYLHGLELDAEDAVNSQQTRRWKNRTSRYLCRFYLA